MLSTHKAILLVLCIAKVVPLYYWLQLFLDIVKNLATHLSVRPTLYCMYKVHILDGQICDATNF